MSPLRSLRPRSLRVILWPFLFSLGFGGCSSISMKLPANRFDSPEARGKQLGAHVDPVIFQGSHDLTLVDPYTRQPPPVDAPNFQRSDLDYEIEAGLGLLDRLDLEVKGPHDSPLRFQLKYQFAGEPQERAKAGNLAAAVTVAGGHGSDSGSAIDVPSASFTMGQWVWDTGLIAGYRVADQALFYAGPFYTQYTISGDITQPISSSGGHPYHFGGIARDWGVSLGAEADVGAVVFKLDVAWSQARFNSARFSSWYPGLFMGFRF